MYYAMLLYSVLLYGDMPSIGRGQRRLPVPVEGVDLITTNLRGEPPTRVVGAVAVVPVVHQCSPWRALLPVDRPVVVCAFRHVGPLDDLRHHGVAAAGDVQQRRGLPSRVALENTRLAAMKGVLLPPSRFLELLVPVPPPPVLVPPSAPRRPVRLLIYCIHIVIIRRRRQIII